MPALAGRHPRGQRASVTRDRLEAATICSDAFLPGALVALYSLDRHFAGFRRLPLTVFYAEDIAPLAKASRDAIRVVAPHARFESVEQPLYRHAVCASDDHRAAFLTLEVFRPRGADRVLFFDADILCVADCSDVLHIDHEFVACAAQQEFAQRSGVSRGRGPLINSGFFAVAGRWISAGVYADLVARIADRHDIRFSDQSVINSYLEGSEIYVLPDSYNFRHWGGINGNGQPVGSNALFRSRRSDLRLIHYSGYLDRPKPWQLTGTPGLDAYAEWLAWARRCADDHPSLADLMSSARAGGLPPLQPPAHRHPAGGGPPGGRDAGSSAGAAARPAKPR